MRTSRSRGGGSCLAANCTVEIGRESPSVTGTGPRLHGWVTSLLVGLLLALGCASPSYAAATQSTSSTAKPPTITSFSPSSGGVGTKVVIKGTNLLKAKVTFDGTAAHVTADTATKITTKVPKGAKTGKIKVKTAGGTATSSTKFDVT